MIPRLSDITQLRDFLDHHNISPSKSMGQNFLVSEEVVESIVEVAQTGPRTVTELGSGVGVLTQALVESGFMLRAIEKDDEFAALLPSVISPKKRSKLTVIHEDLKDVSWSHEEPYQLIGNIPYNLSGYIFRMLTQLEPAPVQAMLLVQKEVGQRAVAIPPDMNLLSLAISLWGTAQKVLNVPPNCFWPQPTIHSQILLLAPHTPPYLPVEKREATMGIARVFFQQKRKQIGGTLKRALHAPDTLLLQIESAGISLDSRPQELSAEQWYTISKLCKNAGLG
ncbi:MAG: 16S rRNA (adenine(1518)-N(6)/adenine(1519)-N(6))-dimethyltransferase RsmA [Candidatus Andersenbacteria bacterium]